MQEPAIFLIGMPGAGKSTLGRALGKALGRQFIDLDHYIQNRFCTTISELFAQRGEEGFRQLEHNMLHEAGEMEDVVIACGGGTPCFYDNMEFMLSRGPVIHLEATRSRLLERLSKRRSHRPAIADKNDEEIGVYIDELTAKRGPTYARAHHTLESTELEDRSSIEQAVKNCISLLNNH